MAVLVCSALAATAGAQTEPFNYIRKATRKESRQATLAQYMPVFEWSPWHVIGPFDNTGREKHAVHYPPEREIDLRKSYPGKDGAEIRWERIDHTDWTVINLLRFGSNKAKH